MTFLTPEFYIFFAIIMILLRVFNKGQGRNVVMLFAGYFFYAYFDIRFMLLMVAETLIVYGIAILIDHRRAVNPKTSARLLALGVCVTLAKLLYFKYAGFFLESARLLLRFEMKEPLRILLPIGISFYTFRSISYMADVYRGQVKASSSFLHVSLYISFFPQLIAGPIIRFRDFCANLDKTLSNAWSGSADITEGLQIFLFGLMKKRIIADQLALFVDQVFRSPSAFGSPTVILAVFSYSVQIYCDFSGYSDMAVGIAKCMGFDLIRNFNMPYLSYNPNEFWKRWHITLSSWLQDYLYIPLGGNRKGRVRTDVNLLLTMLIGGLWHGASWNFIIWGGLHGLALAAHKLFLKLRGKQRGSSPASPAAKVISASLNFIFVSFAWIFFRSSDYQTTMMILRKIFFLEPAGLSQMFIYSFIFGFAMLGIHVFIAKKKLREGYYVLLNMKKFSSKLILAFAVLILICFSYSGFKPFIYSQF